MGCCSRLLFARVIYILRGCCGGQVAAQRRIRCHFGKG
jgi:hypothetical protein